MARSFYFIIVTLLIGMGCSDPAKQNARDPEPASAHPDAAVQMAPDEGFVSLFNGHSLDGWQGRMEDYEAVDGLLICKQGARGDLYTDREYNDFILRLEYRLEAGGNNGIGIRSPISTLPPAVTGLEIQILDDNYTEYQGLEPAQFNGSVYGAAAAKRGHMNPTGEWNAMEIKAIGSHIRVTLNGTLILDVDMDTVGPVHMHGHDYVGLHNKTGHIALCGHHHRVEFRNLRIKELR
ncbi:MAG: DUF1080 domain-containing protein [Phycisphaerales bacterium]|nr:DUF1080 domain-containing protein [Phycisphaerales bacterium]